MGRSVYSGVAGVDTVEGVEVEDNLLLTMATASWDELCGIGGE